MRDDKYSVSRQATSGYNSLHSYFEKAMDTPTGRKLRDFYQQTEKNVLDIHSEARRLQREKKEAAEGEKQQQQPQAESEPQLQKEGEKQTDVKVGEK
ncbi:hypothetical protein KEM55_008180 [Ascosphaera atra]|nr:hypothetical protein KEM55_008180 [Ascosphaera atra]